PAPAPSAESAEPPPAERTPDERLMPTAPTRRTTRSSRRSNRAMQEGHDDESGLAPTLESPTQRMNTLEAVGGQPEGHPGARRLPGLRAVEDHFTVSWDQLVGLPQRFGRDPAGSRDSVRSRLHVERRSQVDDHEVIARVQPSLELHGGDASLPQVTEEARRLTYL